MVYNVSKSETLKTTCYFVNRNNRAQSKENSFRAKNDICESFCRKAMCVVSPEEMSHSEYLLLVKETGNTFPVHYASLDEEE